MIVRALTHPLARATTEELEVFERQFHYPLNSNDHFSISHGPEYLPFFLAMGAATLLIAEHKGNIVGTLVLIRRKLQIGSSTIAHDRRERELRESHYICDLKISPGARSTSALARLMAAAAEIVRPCQSQMCYSVVMTGTSSQPPSYTGRVNVPEFEAVSEIAIVRFLSAPNFDSYSVTEISPTEHGPWLHELSGEGVRAVVGNRGIRSMIPVQQLRHNEGSCVAFLEDTRRGKRLIHASGEEIISSHLSGLRWSTLKAASDVIRFACNVSSELGFPAMFCALPAGIWEQLKVKLIGLEYEQTSATVYGYRVPKTMNWWIDSSEI